jgi:hypothetical protein
LAGTATLGHDLRNLSIARPSSKLSVAAHGQEFLAADFTFAHLVPRFDGGDDICVSSAQLNGNANREMLRTFVNVWRTAVCCSAIPRWFSAMTRDSRGFFATQLPHDIQVCHNVLVAALRSGTGYHARRSAYAEMRTAEISPPVHRTAQN